ncbi:MAG: hypothetical protein RJA07_2462 [Bacteroidota bacterium]|jgi:hypothetical protein
MKKIILLFQFILAFQIVSAQWHAKPILVAFDVTKKPPVPDYSVAKNWAALPNRIDECDKTPIGLHDEQSTAMADVFWIHPTTYTSQADSVFGWNADVNNIELNKKTDKSTILFQASVFNAAGKIYAPRYRQAHLYAFFTPNKSEKWKALHFAYGDIKNAFEYYMQHYNNGRPIIIAAHSQGSLHAFWLLRDYFANKPLMKQLVAAYIVGMPIPKDSLSFLVPCNDASQTNCYVSWCTFQKGFYPAGYNEYKVAECINPITWEADESYASRQLNKGSVLFNFNRIVRHRVDALNKDGLLWIHKPRLMAALFLRIKNYHVGDYNLFYINVRENAKHRVDEFLKKQNK